MTELYPFLGWYSSKYRRQFQAPDKKILVKNTPAPYDLDLLPLFCCCCNCYSARPSRVHPLSTRPTCLKKKLPTSLHNNPFYKRGVPVAERTLTRQILQPFSLRVMPVVRSNAHICMMHLKPKTTTNHKTPTTLVKTLNAQHVPRGASLVQSSEIFRFYRGFPPLFFTVIIFALSCLSSHALHTNY